MPHSRYKNAQGILVALLGALPLKYPAAPGLVCPQVKPSDTPSAGAL